MAEEPRPPEPRDTEPEPETPNRGKDAPRTRVREQTWEDLLEEDRFESTDN